MIASHICPSSSSPSPWSEYTVFLSPFNFFASAAPIATLIPCPSEPEATLAPTLDAILMQMRARAIVIGHTTVLPGRILPRLGGRIIQIDSGMVAGEFYPGGVASALELQGDKATAIYVDRREPLDVPALSAAAATK